MVLTAIAYFQSITRGELSKISGKEVSRDTIASLRTPTTSPPARAARRRARRASEPAIAVCR